MEDLVCNDCGDEATKRWVYESGVVYFCEDCYYERFGEEDGCWLFSAFFLFGAGLTLTQALAFVWHTIKK